MIILLINVNLINDFISLSKLKDHLVKYQSYYMIYYNTKYFLSIFYIKLGLFVIENCKNTLKNHSLSESGILSYNRSNL